MLGVRLTAVASQGEADVICSMLGAEGIRSSERTADHVDAFGNRREILVAEADLPRAQGLLARRE